MRLVRIWLSTKQSSLSFFLTYSASLILVLGRFLCHSVFLCNQFLQEKHPTLADDGLTFIEGAASWNILQVIRLPSVHRLTQTTPSPKRAYTAMVKRSRGSSVASSEPQESSLDEDNERRRHAKLNAVVDPSHPEVVMHCSLPPHREPLEFASIEDFETHYAKDHSNRCVSCGKNFPTAHFLALHIDENHNTFREALQAKGEKTYACFVEDCDRKCSTPQKRRLHLIDKHLFPKVYNFRIVDTGIDKSTSMLHEGRRRRVSTANDPKQARSHQRQPSGAETNTNETGPAPVPHERNPGAHSKHPGIQNEERQFTSNKVVSDATINDLAASMSSLRFVPPSVANRQRDRKSG